MPDAATRRAGGGVAQGPRRPILMRTTLLLFATVILLAGGFALYWAFQPAGAVRNPATAAMAARKAAPVGQGESTYTVGGGKGAWLKQFDEQNHLTHQF